MTSDKHRILYTKPSITEMEVRYAADAATHGWGARFVTAVPKVAFVDEGAA